MNRLLIPFCIFGFLGILFFIKIIDNPPIRIPQFIGVYQRANEESFDIYLGLNGMGTFKKTDGTEKPFKYEINWLEGENDFKVEENAWFKLYHMKLDNNIRGTRTFEEITGKRLIQFFEYREDFDAILTFQGWISIPNFDMIVMYGDEYIRR